MRRFLVLCVLTAALAACRSETADDGRLAVVASFYPVAYAAERVGGDLVSVRNLTPVGVEPHDLELTADAVDRIEGAELVLHIGAAFQPAVVAAAKRRNGGTVDVAAGLRGGRDAHFWLDPTLMAKAVERIADALADVDSDHRPAFRENARAFGAELAALDADYAATLSQCRRKQIVTAHASFDYLARRYGLTQHAITGVAPDAEPDPQHFADLADRVRRDRITTIFYEHLVPRDYADTLARETGARTAVLSPLEGLSQREQDGGDTYLTVMRRNLAALAAALECPPPA